MSRTTVLHPIIAALVGSEKFLGTDRTWTGASPEQKHFLEFFGANRGQIASIPEIETLASLSASEINAFLATRGFSITVEPFAANEFGVASVLDMLVEWLGGGEKKPITVGGKEYAGVRIKDHVSYFHSNDHAHPVACLETKPDARGKTTKVYMTLSDSKEDTLAQAIRIGSNLRRVAEYAAIQFPMVDLDQKVDINWLVGLKTTAADGLEWAVANAQQQTKLRMNEKGARAQSAAVMTMRSLSASMPKPDMVINAPFIIWFQRDEVTLPLFSAHVTPEDWKEPKDLSTP